LALAAGTIATGVLVAWDPLPTVGALVTPLLLAVLLRTVDLAAILHLLAEPVPPAAHHAEAIDAVVADGMTDSARAGGALADGALADGAASVAAGVSLRSIGAVVASAVGVVRTSRMLQAVLLAEVLWAAGMVAFELFTPARLRETTASAQTAAVLMGPATAMGWTAAAAGAALVPRLVRRVGAGRAGGVLRLAQGGAVTGIALAAGPAGVVAAFVAAMAVHGAAHPVHHGLLHRGVQGPGHRATVVSVNGMLAQAAGATGGIALGVLADVVALPTAVLAGGVLLALPAPLYLLAGRWSRTSFRSR
jgi:hypothetical protein